MMEVIDFINTKGPSFGYFIKLSKGSYLLGKCESHAVAVERKNNLVSRFGLNADIIHIHPDNSESDESRVVYATQYGSKILGAYIGSDEYILAKQTC